MNTKTICCKWIGLCTLIACIFLATPATTHAAVLLKLNSSGSAVTTLQQRLASLNYKITSIDGIYGNETRNAVLAFQRDNKLSATGSVDTITWNKLSDAIMNPQNVVIPKKKSKTTFRKGQTAKPAPAADHANNFDFSVDVSATPAAAAVIRTAKQYIGVPYQFGGTSPKGFDCSGYLQFVFAKHNINLPRTADLQYKVGATIAANKLIPGDMVFFSTYEKGASHCGIYIGSGKFIHASSSKGIRIDELKDAYWKPKYLGAKRILNG